MGQVKKDAASLGDHLPKGEQKVVFTNLAVAVECKFSARRFL